MADLSISNTFTAGTTIASAKVNENFDDVKNYINDRNSGAAAWNNANAAAAAITSLTATAATITNITATNLIVTNTTKVSVTNSGILSISNTIIPLATENYDSLSEWNTSTYTFTASSAGYYLAHLQMRNTVGSSTLIQGIKIYKNGASVSYMQAPLAEGTAHLSCQALISLSASDTIYFFTPGALISSEAGEIEAFITRIF